MNQKIIDIPIKVLKAMYSTMLKIRLLEEKIAELYPQEEMHTPVHLCTGQEAIATGVCANLKKDDYIFSNHRGHGHYIAKGGSLKALMAELYGKANGCSKGKGGSMHLVAPEVGILGTSAIVGGGLPLAVGTALASVMQRNRRVSAVFFGDGAIDQGAFHESLNFAALKKLPVVFVCENNFYATNSPQSARQPADNIYKRAQGYNIPGVRIDGNDVITVFKIAKRAIKQARSGAGPTLIECRTYRWKQHVGPNGDVESGCRPKKELQRWIKNCPLKRYKKFLLNKGVMLEGEMDKICREIQNKLKEAIASAKNSPVVDDAKLMQDLY